MKNLYLVIFLTLISPLLTNIVLAQCDDVTLESLTNPGPFEVETIVWSAVVWCGLLWSVVCCGLLWCCLLWCGVVWSAVVWCGLVWCAVVW